MKRTAPVVLIVILGGLAFLAYAIILWGKRPLSAVERFQAERNQRRAKPVVLPGPLAAFQPLIPKTERQLRRMADEELIQARIDHDRSKPHVPGMFAVGFSRYAGQFQNGVHDGDIVTYNYKWQWCKNRADKPKIPADGPDPEFRDDFTVTLRYRAGKFKWQEWHQTKSDGRRIPPEEQVKHYNPKL